MAPVIDNYQFPSFIDTFPIFMNYAAFRQGFPMELKDLETFRLIATLGHVSQAAERLGQSQPALTKCVRRLEADTALGFGSGSRWLRMLGFEDEGVSRAFGPDGADFRRFARVLT